MGEAMLKEICPGVFIRDFRTGWYAVPQLNYSYIPGSGRSLMVDAGMPEEVSPDGLSLMSRDLEELGIRWQDLDCIITHAHRDHVGLAHILNEKGARVFVNPVDMQTREIMEFDLCMNRLAEIMRFWNENEPLEAAYLSLFGYCMKVQPFWFCLDSQKDDIYAIQASGVEMIAKAHKLAPDDAVISAIAKDSTTERFELLSELNRWGDSALREYFLSVLRNVNTLYTPCEIQCRKKFNI